MKASDVMVSDVVGIAKDASVQLPEKTATGVAVKELPGVKSMNHDLSILPVVACGG
jgi:hypothetical protein